MFQSSVERQGLESVEADQVDDDAIGFVRAPGESGQLGGQCLHWTPGTLQLQCTHAKREVIPQSLEIPQQKLVAPFSFRILSFKLGLGVGWVSR